MSSILVTGGAGFIGSHIVDLLIENDYEVIIIDNLSTGKKENLNPKARFYHVELTGDLASIFEKHNIDIVIHHAAQISVIRSLTYPIGDARSNIFGTINLLSYCKGIKVIYASSGGTVYGGIPPYKEDDLIHPLCPYGISKYCGEMYIRLHSDYTILRYSNVYGERQDGKGEAGVIAIFKDLIKEGKQCSINGDGNQTRDFIHVSDVAKANLLALNQGHNQTINIGSGVETSINEVYSVLSNGTELIPTHNLPIAGEIKRSVLNIDKAHKVLGWSPQIKFNG